MLEELSEIKGLEIYAPNGIFVGTAEKFLFDQHEKRITGILVEDANPVLVDEGIAVKIPYRYVQSVGDIIILKVFPKHIGKDGKVE